MNSSTSEAHVRVPLRTVLLTIAGLWLCYFALNTLRASFALELQGELLWRRGLVCIVGFSVTLALWALLRLFDRQKPWLQIAAALVLAMPAAGLVAWANERIFADVQERVEAKIAERMGYTLRRDQVGNVIIEAPAPRATGVAEDPLGADGGRAQIVLPGREGAGGRLIGLLDLALSRYFLILAWAALYFTLLAGERARAAERREERFRSAARSSELRSLRYQVNPHFLFNALNSLSSLVMTGKAERAEEMIQGLSAFYRRSLADDPTGDVELAEEFDLQRDYLAVETLRFPDRLRTVIALPGDLANVPVPGMILQPLVENSVRYAVAPVNRPVTVSILAREEYGRLVITVSDDGPGVPPGTRHGFGIGLANVRDRLAARFGDEAGVVSGPVEGGYRTELRMPLVTE
ncbi:sensor histidine kinase [Altererythrobacter aerius]|uniref:Sensor histidine kinase n=1 Tax=Tsuneonella aeria TaxID=1837929 RepID=A0A6I4TFL0_9SPHN|nr:histidine kinase [Tsuneonella aeria]MXO75406.1 sensor histidine kinase [Tsuneonella aeria]